MQNPKVILKHLARGYVLQLIPLTAIVLAAAGCGGERLAGQDLYGAYQAALADTEASARGDWETDPEGLAAAVTRLQQYFGEVTAESVERLTREVYAAETYMCDTLHIARSASAIEAYFRKTAERVDFMRVTIFDYSAAGREVYTRWSMTIAAPELAGGEPVTTYGMSHFRFDAEGKVILHQDFWDASAGFFEHLTGLGTIIPRIRGFI